MTSSSLAGVVTFSGRYSPPRYRLALRLCYRQRECAVRRNTHAEGVASRLRAEEIAAVAPCPVGHDARGQILRHRKFRGESGRVISILSVRRIDRDRDTDVEVVALH